jgi:hypothetical protein
MSDISTPTTDTPKQPETPPPADGPKPRRELLDNIVVKFLFSLVAWLGPLPVAIVALRFWFANLAPEDQSGTDPFQSLRHTLTSFSNTTPDYIPVAALLPSLVLLLILYRHAAARIFAVCALCVFAVAEFIAITQLFGGPGAP